MVDAADPDRAGVVAEPAPAVHPKSRGVARRAMRRGPTIDDVARLAGVSRGTVSRVLNGAQHVSPGALAAVQQAMRDSGYVVNASARTLVTRKTNAVAFVLSEPQERLFEDPNFPLLLKVCTQAFAEHDISVMLMLTGACDARERVLRYVRAGHVDGVLVVSAHGGDPLLGQLQDSGTPMVSCGRPVDAGAPVPYVAADDRGGAVIAVRHLRELGRRRIATITGPLDTSGGIERLEGYRSVVGRNAPRRLVAPATDYSYAAGEAAMTQLLETEPDLDAVFVASDLLAAGAMAVIRRAGRRVPEDIAVVGFDDSPVALTTDPPLTTVRQPLDVVGTQMVRLLLDQISGQPAVNVIVPTELVVRAST